METEAVHAATTPAIATKATRNLVVLLYMLAKYLVPAMLALSIFVFAVRYYANGGRYFWQAACFTFGFAACYVSFAIVREWRVRTSLQHLRRAQGRLREDLRYREMVLAEAERVIARYQGTDSSLGERLAAYRRIEDSIRMLPITDAELSEVLGEVCVGLALTGTNL